jgi:hypothetical protein
MKALSTLMMTLTLAFQAQAATTTNSHFTAETLESICQDISSSIQDATTLKNFKCDFHRLSDSESKSQVTQGEICQEYAEKELGMPVLPEDTKPQSVKVSNLPDGRVQVTVDHGIIANVNLDQMNWWYKNLTNTKILEVKEKNCKPYTILDKDHIDVGAKNVSATGEIVPQSLMHFNEITRFNGKSYHLNEEVLVTAINKNYIRYEKRKLFGISLGLTLGLTERYFRAEKNGVRVISVLTAGINSEEHPTLSHLNKILIGKLFPNSNQMAWVNHCSEEVANLSLFIPWILKKQK